MKDISNIYVYNKYISNEILFVNITFISMFKDIVGYDRGISIEINAFKEDFSQWEKDLTLCKYSYPYPIFQGKIIWGKFDCNAIKRDHKELNVNDLKKFCEKIVKLKVFE